MHAMQAWRSSSQGDRDIKNREADRRKNTTPSTTLFVVNFDVVRTRERDLQDLYERYGRLRRVQVCLPCPEGTCSCCFCGTERLRCRAMPCVSGTAIYCDLKTVVKAWTRLGPVAVQVKKSFAFVEVCHLPTACACPSYACAPPCCRSRGSLRSLRYSLHVDTHLQCFAVGRLP